MRKRRLASLLLCVLISGICSSAEDPRAQSDLLPARSFLNTAVFTLDSLLMDVLSSLELIAMTPEAKAGDWPGIKPYLARLQKRFAGVCCYIMPDGNFYSVANDFTNLNLSDRGYFKPLFAGNNVMGFPIYSRSTGRKSAMIACPIFAGGGVAGAVGVSLYLDDLHGLLNGALDLPPDITWFAVDSEGTTMLDRDSDFIFMNALELGSRSLKEGIGAALKSDGGSMQYELGGRVRRALYRKLPNFDWRLILARIEGEDVAPPPTTAASLSQLVTDLQLALDRIDSRLSRELSLGDEARAKLLADIINREPAVTTASYVDAHGILRRIEPREYKNVEGSDISGQEHVAEMMKSRQPVFSSGFLAVEGFPAVVIAHPVIGAENEFAGSINLLLRPEFVVKPLLKTAGIPPGSELWIMQTDGQIVYDLDSGEIGRMLFSDPLYAGYETLLRLGKRIASEESGSGEYVFQAAGSEEKVHKAAAWNTVRLHGREWRVVFCSPSGQD